MAIDPNIKKKADDIRNKVYGKEVRESLASGLEEMSSDVIENEGRQSVVEGRQDSVESQWQVVSDEMTDKDVISAPEIIVARDGEPNLKARLDKEKQEVTAQLAETEEQKTKEIINVAKLPSSTGLTTRKRKRPLVSFVDDDGNRAVLTKLVPLAEQYNIPFTLAIVSDWATSDMNNSLKADELKGLQDNLGFEISSHGKTHIAINSDMSEEQQLLEIYESWRVLRESGLNVDSIVYPYGQSTPFANDIVSRFYKAGVGTNESLNSSPFNTYQLRRLPFPGGARTFEYYKSKVDEAVANNEWLIWMLHCGQSVHDAEQQQILEQLIQYIQSLDVEIVNVTEGVDISGNAIDINANGQRYYLANDGVNNIINTVPMLHDGATGQESLTADTLPSELENNKIYFGAIYRVSETSKMPTANPGILYALKSGSGYSREWYIANGRTYTRNGTPNDTGWAPWNRIWETSEIEVTADFGTVESGEVSRNIFNNGSFSVGTSVIVTPQQTFHGHLMLSYHISGGGQLMVNLFNPTGTARTVGEITFKVSLLIKS